jgi:hypothetical protein
MFEGERIRKPDIFEIEAGVLDISECPEPGSSG